MKKKITAGILSAVLIAGMALSVSASDQREHSMEVTYTQTERYILNIPKSQGLSTTQEVTTEVGVTGLNLAPGNRIVLKVTAGVDENGTVVLKRSDGESIESSLTVKDTSDEVGLNEVFAEFTADGCKELSFSALKPTSGGTDIKAGDYSGTLTFTANIVPETTTTP